MQDRTGQALSAGAAPPRLEVTAALVRGAGGRFLLARRPPGGRHGGLWEFPGGKREPGETLAECLARELREELGLETLVGQLLASLDHDYPGLPITLHLFECTLPPALPPPAENESLRWVTAEELDAYPLPEADHRLVQALGGRP